MPRVTAPLQIPFDTKTGDLVNYVYPSGTGMPSDHVVWRENYAFDDTLVYEGFGRGRSAAHFYFKSQTTGRRYQVFMTDLDVILRKKEIKDATVYGTWTFCKRGHNYGLRLSG